MKCFINTHKKIFVNSVNMPLKQKISVDYGTEPTMELTLLDKCGKPFEIPENANFYLAGDVDFNQVTPHCFFSMNYTISGHVITFNINTYSEAFLTKVKNPDTSMVVEVGMKVNEKSTVLLQDEILAQPRVYAEGQPIGGIVLQDVTVTADTMLKDVTAINTTGEVVTGNISDAVITTDETNGLTVSVSKGYLAQNESENFPASTITTDETNGLTVNVSKGYLAQNESKNFPSSTITTDETNGLTVSVSKGYLAQNESKNFPSSTITTDETNGLTVSVSKGYLAQNESKNFPASTITETENQVTISRGWLNEDKAFQVGGGEGFIFDKSPSTQATTVQIIPETFTADLTDFGGMFKSCSKLSTIPTINTSKGTNFSQMFTYCFVLTSVPQLDTSNGTNFNKMFYQCKKLTTIPALDTSNGTNFSQMFNTCSALTSVPQLDTSNGTDFNNMFYQCSKLTTIPALDTSNGTNFSQMFAYCSALTSVPQLDTSNGTNFSYMFTYCSALTSVPQLDTSNGTNFSYMFQGCSKLTTIPALDTSNGTNFYSMFSSCSALTDFGGLLNVKKSFNLSYSPYLTHDSLLNVLNGLYDLTGGTAQTLTLGSTTLAKLTDAEKAIATNKNWTLK